MGGGQAADREASSCNAAQLPRFLVTIIIVVVVVVVVQDSEGQTGSFLGELCMQSEQEHQQYVDDVFHALDGKS